MAGGFYGQFLDTVGMEYETTALPRDYVSEKVRRVWMMVMGDHADRINIVHDASIEFIADWVRTDTRLLSISQHTAAAKHLYGIGQGSSRIMGTELFTTPMELPEFEATIYPMIDVLKRFGDYTSKRASVHYHFGFANNLRLLKNLLRLCLQLDPVLYRLGGMGDTFRGNINYAAYARPLMNACAVPVTNNRKLSLTESLTLSHAQKAAKLQAMKNDDAGRINAQWVQIINPFAALDATSIEDFWAAFGVNYPSGGSIKYNPPRYSGCNFFAIASHGTMEFRHFNQSMNTPLLVAIPKFLRGVVELATVLNKHEIQSFEPIDCNNEVSMADATEIVYRLLSSCREKEIEHLPTDREVDLILETIENSHFEPLPETPVHTHIKEYAIDAGTAIRGHLLPLEKVLNPEYVDIHNISEKIISIFD